jgi:PTS system arbutin-like IIC component
MIEYFGHFFGVNFAADPGGESGLKMIAGIKTLDTGIIGARTGEEPSILNW